MAERDELLDVLAQARPDPPDEVVSPHAPAAQALLEEILSMDTMSSDTMSHTTSDTMSPTSPTRATKTRPSRRRRLVLAGTAAAAAAAVATATILTVDSGEQVEAATVHAAAAETSAALAESGRAELRYHSEYDGGDRGEREDNGTEWFAFSGDDVSIRARPDGWPTDVVTRIVDGRTYVFPDPPDAPANANEVNAIPYRLDPQRLLDALRDVSTFESIGREDVDGVPTRHLRATDPDDANAAAWAFSLDLGPEGTVTTLDVWVDDDDMVRRIDISIVRPAPDDFEQSFSVRFFDFGAPITIERPAPDEPVAIGEPGR